MKAQNFKKAVYGLAKFNPLLTKGYGKEWKQSDYDGYTKKNKELNKLVNVAVQKKYPVFYDGRTNVIYFIFGNSLYGYFRDDNIIKEICNNKAQCMSTLTW